MELPLLYNETTVAERQIKISREKLEGVNHELDNFESEAKFRVRKMEQMGLLEYTPTGESPAIEAKEIASIAYLKDFISGSNTL